MIKFYVATEAKITKTDISGHITLAFMEPAETGKVRGDLLTLLEVNITEVVAVEYWKHVDLTVAVVHAGLLQQIHEELLDAGLTYTHEFIPHITLGKGNLTEQHKHLVGKAVRTGGAYFRFKDFK